LARLGTVTAEGPPQALLEDETLDQALRQLVLFGRVGLPVVSPDFEHLRGWITRHSVLRTIAARLDSAQREAERGQLASEISENDARARLHSPRTALHGYEMVQLTINAGSPISGRRLGEVVWPTGAHVVAVTENHELIPAHDDAVVGVGERVVLLIPNSEKEVLQESQLRKTSCLKAEPTRHRGEP
jgi:chloride channel protein, CIC family